MTDLENSLCVGEEWTVTRMAFMYGIAVRGSYLCLIQRECAEWQMGLFDSKGKSLTFAIKIKWLKNSL